MVLKAKQEVNRNWEQRTDTLVTDNGGDGVTAK